MPKKERLELSKNRQESRSSAFTRNKQELSKSTRRAALSLLEEIDRDWRGMGCEGCLNFSHGLAPH